MPFIFFMIFSLLVFLFVSPPYLTLSLQGSGLGPLFVGPLFNCEPPGLRSWTFVCKSPYVTSSLQGSSPGHLFVSPPV